MFSEFIFVKRNWGNAIFSHLLISSVLAALLILFKGMSTDSANITLKSYLMDVGMIFLMFFISTVIILFTLIVCYSGILVNLNGVEGTERLETWLDLYANMISILSFGFIVTKNLQKKLSDKEDPKDEEQ